MIISNTKIFFENFIGSSAIEFQQIPQSGSSRINYIGKSEIGNFIVTYNENIRENEAFFYFSKEFSKLGLNTPKVLAINKERNTYIQEFLGDNTLSEIINKEGHSLKVKSLVKKSLYQLFELQQKTQNKIDFSQTFEYEEYNNIPILHDLFYFKFMFADILEVKYQKANLIKEFYNLINIIENLSPKGLIIRDFQARNIIVNGDNVYFIDYQSAMYGSLMYDVVSFLYQAKANFPETFRQEMIDFYINLFDNEKDRIQLKTSVLPIRLIRNLQVLGAYGFRGLIQRKEHFLKSIPQGIENLKQTTKEWDKMENFPELNTLIENIKIKL